MTPTKASNRDIAARSTVKISDLAILHAALTSKIWSYFFTKKWLKIIPLSVGYYLRFSRAICGVIYWCPIRYKLGSQTFGIITYIAAISSCIGYNNTQIHCFLKPFSMWITPFLLWGKTKEELYAFLCENVESQFLIFYGGWTALSGLAHLVTIWLGKSNASMSKRGNSYLVWLLSRRFKVNEYFVIGILEPLIAFGVVYLLWAEFDDRYGAVFLGVATLSEAVQQLIDQAHKEHLKSIINT
jgi:hypothetical protein